MSARLSRWNWLLPELCYRGGVLAASMLWHTFTVLEPPEHIIKELQSRPVNFLWWGG